MKMALSKNCCAYKRCLSVAIRHYNTESAPAASATQTQQVVEDRRQEKMSALSQLRVLTSSQLQAINTFSKSIVKTAYEQGVSLAINRDWIRTIQRLPTLLSNPDQPNTTASTTKSAVTETADNVKVETTAVHPQAVTLELPKIPKIGMGTTGDPSPATGYSLPQVLTNLIPFASPVQTSETAQVLQIPQWKLNKSNTVPKDAIQTRTRHIIISLATAATVQSRLKRIEDLITHLQQHPQTKSIAVKNGAISTLLRLRRCASDQDTQAVTREALAMLGHIETLPGRGIRILAMDGGGTRGVLVIEQLRKLEELTGRRVCELFDFICGVSTGAIMAMLFGPHKKNLQDCSTMYREISVRIFSQNAFWGTGSLLWSHSYYDTALWEQILKTYIGDVPLIKTARDPECPKVAAVSAVVNQARVKPYVFRNYELPSGVPAFYAGTSKAELWQAVRASAAAPSYFEEYRLGDILHQDGGILVNNPTAIAIHEAKLLWPGEPIQCVVSFGTGRNHPVELASQSVAAANGDTYSSWKTKFAKILDSATDTEAVHEMLHDLLPRNVYYRFNPYVHEFYNMAEIRPEKLEQLVEDALMYTRRNEEKFEQVAAALTQPRSHLQRGQDWIKMQTRLITNT